MATEPARIRQLADPRGPFHNCSREGVETLDGSDDDAPAEHRHLRTESGDHAVVPHCIQCSQGLVLVGLPEEAKGHVQVRSPRPPDGASVSRQLVEEVDDLGRRDDSDEQPAHVAPVSAALRDGVGAG